MGFGRNWPRLKLGRILDGGVNIGWCDTSPHEVGYFLIAAWIAQVFYSYTRAICQRTKQHVTIFSCLLLRSKTKTCSLSCYWETPKPSILEAFPWWKTTALRRIVTETPFRKLNISYQWLHALFIPFKWMWSDRCVSPCVNCYDLNDNTLQLELLSELL